MTHHPGACVAAEARRDDIIYLVIHLSPTTRELATTLILLTSSSSAIVATAIAVAVGSGRSWRMLRHRTDPDPPPELAHGHAR